MVKDMATTHFLRSLGEGDRRFTDRLFIYVICLLLSLVVFLFIFFEILGESRDWYYYSIFFDSLHIAGLDALSTSRFEPGFVIVSIMLTTVLSSNLAVYGIIAACAMFLKCWAMSQFTYRFEFYFVVVFFYFVRFFPLHELTQIRVACSVAFLFIAFVLLWRGNWIGGLTACAAAVAFHFLALFVIPFLLLTQSYSRKTVIIASLAVLLTTLFGIELVINYFQDSFKTIRMHQEMGFGDKAANVISAALLLDWGMIIAGLVMWDRLSPIMKHILLIELVGMAIFYASRDFPVISHRVREYYATYWIFYVSQGLQQKGRVKEFVFLFVIANFVLYLYIYFFHEIYFI